MQAVGLSAAPQSSLRVFFVLCQFATLDWKLFLFYTQQSWSCLNKGAAKLDVLPVCFLRAGEHKAMLTPIKAWCQVVS